MNDLALALERTGAAHAAAVVVDPSGVVERAGETETVFALASVTKLLSAFATLVAVEEGSVALDDAVGPSGSTLRHVLAHASGLALEATDGIVAPLGERRHYSNAGIEAAAAHVATATGVPFGEYLHEAVCAPLSMASTRLPGSAARSGVATAGDLGRFASELLTPTLLAAATLEEASATVYPGLAGVLPGFGWMDPCDWGLGFEVRGEKSPHWTGAHNSPRTFGHFGQSGTFCWVDPDAHVAAVVLTDRRFDAEAKRAWPPLSDGVLARQRGDSTGPLRFAP